MNPHEGTRSAPDAASGLAHSDDRITTVAPVAMRYGPAPSPDAWALRHVPGEACIELRGACRRWTHLRQRVSEKVRATGSSLSSATVATS